MVTECYYGLKYNYCNKTEREKYHLNLEAFSPQSNVST